MSKQHNSLALFTLLILCVVSIWIAPVFLGIGILAMEFMEAEFDPFEFDEDLILIDCDTDGIIDAMSVRIEGLLLYMHPAALAGVFSPPRPFGN